MAEQEDATITFNGLAIKDDPKYLLLMQSKSQLQLKRKGNEEKILKGRTLKALPVPDVNDKVEQVIIYLNISKNRGFGAKAVQP